MASQFQSEIGYGRGVAHISEDDLERYAMRTVPEAELAPLEEHLLICTDCRSQLESTERYVEAVRRAAASMTAEPCRAAGDADGVKPAAVQKP